MYLHNNVASAKRFAQSIAERLDTFIDTERESAPSALESITSSNACPLSLEHVSYTYPNSNKAALDDITISFERNTSYAVLGRSGAGKSTLANVIRGALPIAHGRFTIFGQVATMRTSNLSSIIGFIGQDPYLFNRTLRENLSLGVSSTDDAHLIAALESVGLGEKFSSLDDGLDTVIGETGIGFSGGETYRIALARVLIADVPIIIVDEPFSALDPETERDLIDTLLDSCKGRTLIVITHHLAEIERFDHVVFIEDSRIDLEGSPEELMRTSERFQTLIAFDR